MSLHALRCLLLSTMRSYYTLFAVVMAVMAPLSSFLKSLFFFTVLDLAARMIFLKFLFKFGALFFFGLRLDKIKSWAIVKNINISYINQMYVISDHV